MRTKHHALPLLDKLRVNLISLLHLNPIIFKIKEDGYQVYHLPIYHYLEVQSLFYQLAEYRQDHKIDFNKIYIIIQLQIIFCYHIVYVSLVLD